MNATNGIGLIKIDNELKANGGTGLRLKGLLFLFSFFFIFFFEILLLLVGAKKNYIKRVI